MSHFCPPLSVYLGGVVKNVSKFKRVLSGGGERGEKQKKEKSVKIDSEAAKADAEKKKKSKRPITTTTTTTTNATKAVTAVRGATNAVTTTGASSSLSSSSSAPPEVGVTPSGARVGEGEKSQKSAFLSKSGGKEKEKDKGAFYLVCNGKSLLINLSIN